MNQKKTKVLVCGGRDFADKDAFFEAMDKLQSRFGFATVIHSGARGADALAGLWARERGIDVRTYPAQWNKYGRSAGFRRNEDMLRRAKPDYVFAFPGGARTAHMVQISRDAGINVLTYWEISNE